jgi:hypothetical protein
MMNRLLLLTTIFAAAAIAQLSSPRAGFVRDRSGALRPVLGIAGNFVTGDPIAEGVISAGFGKTVGYAKKESELLVLRSGEIVERMEAPRGEAIFYPDRRGEIAEIYFPETRELWRAQKSGFEKMLNVAFPHSTVTFDGDEISLASGERLRIREQIQTVEWLSDAWLVVRGASALYAIRVTGEIVVNQLPEAAK